MKLERMHQPLLPFREFRRRMSRYAGVALLLVGMSLACGAIGYHQFAGLPWVDSILNASMILTGMGPVDPMRSTAAKLFASFYALFSGVAFLSIVGVLIAPIVHRYLHRFHLEMDEDQS
jgi:hypothetical protein